MWIQKLVQNQKKSNLIIETAPIRQYQVIYM